MLSYLAYALKRGDTFDPEDFKTTHRLRVARGLLAEVGIEPTVAHSTLCARHPSNVGRGMRDLGCWDQCRTLWPESATDDMFEDAARAASAIQSLRGRVAASQGVA